MLQAFNKENACSGVKLPVKAAAPAVIAVALLSGTAVEVELVNVTG